MDGPWKPADKFILNDIGEPVPCDDLKVWAEWFGTPGNRQIVYTQIDETTDVSTVFLGLDHNFSSSKIPILWETLVFGGPLDGEMYRYETRLQAQRGHDEMVAKAKLAAMQPGERRIELE